MIVRVYRNVSAGRETFVSCKGTFPAEIDALLPCPMVVDRWPLRGPLAGMLSTMARNAQPVRVCRRRRRAVHHRGLHRPLGRAASAGRRGGRPAPRWPDRTARRHLRARSRSCWRERPRCWPARAHCAWFSTGWPRTTLTWKKTSASSPTSTPRPTTPPSTRSSHEPRALRLRLRALQTRHPRRRQFARARVSLGRRHAGLRRLGQRTDVHRHRRQHVHRLRAVVGAADLGHANPAIVDAVQSAATLGTSFGAPTQAESDLAELVHRDGPVDRKGALLLERHRGDDERAAPGARLYRPRTADQVRRLLSRARRRVPDLGRQRRPDQRRARIRRGSPPPSPPTRSSSNSTIWPPSRPRSRPTPARSPR